VSRPGPWFNEDTGEGSLRAWTEGEITLFVQDDRLPFRPFRAVVSNPGSGGPFANVVATGEDSRALDVSDLDDVLVLGEHVAELLARGAVTHGAVDVFEDLCGVAGAVAQEFLDLLSDADGLHALSLLGPGHPRP